ncbi:E3 ubiquitin-protein ligase DZIP3-like [Stylophora pistillata]|uniref:E3 ubiquitin-protein ligase DZIP3-like n=1 Tax=Stylophora pistillata TaxID=50429 RepID=UPI000C03D73E|nr:E3 ubiquitin-protein ligase DZIP3-like [Stylophora pistillata]
MLDWLQPCLTADVSNDLSSSGFTAGSTNLYPVVQVIREAAIAKIAVYVVVVTAVTDLDSVSDTFETHEEHPLVIEEGLYAGTGDKNLKLSLKKVPKLVVVSPQFRTQAGSHVITVRTSSDCKVVVVIESPTEAAPAPDFLLGVIFMATASASFTSSKETTNYARLCRLLVDVGSQVLRSTFDKIHPPATLHKVLGKTSVHHATLHSLYKGKKKVLNPTQWSKLYPAHSPVSSATFDITLLTVLLRNICGLSPPATGWDRLPPAANTSIADDIARVKYYRNTVYGHASQAAVDDISFSSYWQEIRQALVRLGKAHLRTDIDNLEHDCMDPDIEEHYRELMKQWKKDDDNIKEKVEEMEASIRDSMEKIIVPLKTTIEKDLRDTAGKIESDMKEMQEKLGCLSASVEKSAKEASIRDSVEKIIVPLKTTIEKDLRDSAGKIESEMKEMKEKLGSLTASVEKSGEKVRLCKHSILSLAVVSGKRLQRVQIVCAGYVLGRYAKEADCLQLGWLPVIERRSYQLLQCVLKALYFDYWPQYLKLEQHVPARNLRWSCEVRLKVPIETGTFQDSSAAIFNALPSYLRNCTDFRSFKSNLTSYLFNNAGKRLET